MLYPFEVTTIEDEVTKAVEATVVNKPFEPTPVTV